MFRYEGWAALGRTRPRRDKRVPTPKWREKAERGYHAALNGGRDASRIDYIHAILALLDGQPTPRGQRLFRGHWLEKDDHHYPDRLDFDEVSDVSFLRVGEFRHPYSGTPITAREAFLFLYQYVEYTGGDTRPLWRRSRGMWPEEQTCKLELYLASA